VGTLTEPQTWAIIGVFFAGFLGILTVFAMMQRFTVQTLGDRLIDKINGLDQKIDIKIDGLDQKIDGLDQKIDSKVNGLDQKIDSKIDGLRNEMNAQFETVNARLTTLDRDVHVLTERVFRTDDA
jgi:predicted PurR-regulated permease PerM